MADYEDEQLEALRRWWEENGRSVIVGAILAIAGVAGWQGWQWYTDTQSEGAAAVYSQIQVQMPMGDAETIVAAAETLRGDFARTHYATLGALSAARVMVRNNDYDSAVEWLEWAREQARDPSLEAVATLRLARVLGERGDIERALGLLADGAAPGWEALHHETRGDLLIEQGDYERAAAAYQQALDADGEVTDREIVRLKRNRAEAGKAAGDGVVDS